MSANSRNLLADFFSKTEHYRCLQEWLQFFAWTKDTKAVKLAERASHMPQQQQRLLKGHPIFCFETAIKLLYWCGFVYEHDEVSSCSATGLKQSGHCTCDMKACFRCLAGAL